MSSLLQYLFKHFETYTWAYFFGIIAISIFYISKYIKKWNQLLFLLGLSISLGLFFTEINMEENTNLFFVFICGLIGVIGMLIPGLSGSYLLVLLGNYELLMSKILLILNPYYIQEYLKGEDLNDFEIYFKLFCVFLAGHIFGILLFSRIIRWLIKNYKNETFSTLTGFITGSLIWIWPWKNQNFILEESGKINTLSFPDLTSFTDLYSVFIVLLGSGTIILVEQIAKRYRNV